MPPVTLYTKDAEQELWRQAREVANSRDQSLSDFVGEAVREHLTRAGRRPAETALALARLLVQRLEREQGHTKAARKRVSARRRA